MDSANWNTTKFHQSLRTCPDSMKDVLCNVYQALQEKGYSPVGQIVGYLLSGDPTFITSYKNARTMITQFERDQVLEEMLKSYLEKM
ncbi:MAG: IreB family regulatory phosphoprotein [Firmicutes bacterium]|jgi:uncharacterized protein (UPF0297 family)|nr:IreB family regulatory phosphoprotein [Bacillota bacterium]